MGAISKTQKLLGAAPYVQKDRNRFCPECGHPLAIINEKGKQSDDKHNFTCTNQGCDRFMRFTHPKRFVRKIDVKPIIRRF